jgi:hypothetical protein
MDRLTYGVPPCHIVKKKRLVPGTGPKQNKESGMQQNTILEKESEKGIGLPNEPAPEGKKMVQMPCL